MKISYAITVCNEYEEIKRLLRFLLENKREQDEIVVLVDMSKNTPTSPLLGYLNKLSYNNFITLKESRFNGDFSHFKNQLHSSCTGDFIFNIDADELPHINLIKSLPQILENNVDLIWVSRINTVEGITDEYVKKWRWRVDEKGWVNYPDKQARIYRNSPYIKWEGVVHETITGFESYAELPTSEEYSIYHPKTLQKQITQNQFYENL